MPDETKIKNIDEHTIERLIRLEANHMNLKDNFSEFKAETQKEFKTLSTKIDNVMDEVTGIKVIMAKYMGAFIVIIAGIEIVIKLFLK